MIIKMLANAAHCGHEMAGPFRDAFIIHHPIGSKIFLLFLITVIAIAIIIKFLVAYLVYKDAVLKNIDNRKIWFFIVFFTSILGVIFYFLLVIYQHKNNVSNIAPQTQSTNSNQPFSSTKVCKNCGSVGDGKFCATCGTRFT